MSIKRRCFLSYHKADQDAVDNFIETFDYYHKVFTYRAIREMDSNIINSSDHDYVMRRIRELYLSDSTVTIVLVGECTWARKYVDWEIASTLRNDANNRRSGLFAILLPSVSERQAKAPDRFSDNWDGDNLYARFWKYPKTPESLSFMIEDAFSARTTRAHLIDNSRRLQIYNRTC